MRSISDILREIESVPDYAGHTVDSVNCRNGYGDTPLHIVSTWGDCEAIKIILSSGADIDAAGESGYTALHCAAEQNHVEAVRLLLERGAQLLPDKDGETPIDLASSLGHKDVVKALSNGI